MSEPAAPAEQRRASTRTGVALRAPLAAVTLLTIVPVPARVQRRLGAAEVVASAPFFPLVGALLGLVAGLVGHAVADRSDALLGGVVATLLLVLLTGALHLDGLADGADALGARGGSRERRLEIMRDSATGAYGTAAIGGWLLVVAAALAALPPAEWAVALAWALAVARTLAVAHARVLPPARPEGLGAGFAMRTGALVAAVVVLLVLAAVVTALPADAGALSAPSTTVLVAAAAGGLSAAGVVGTAAQRLVGGRTGDTLGATIALGEALALLGAALAIG